MAGELIGKNWSSEELRQGEEWKVELEEHMKKFEEMVQHLTGVVNEEKKEVAEKTATLDHLGDLRASPIHVSESGTTGAGCLRSAGSETNNAHRHGVRVTTLNDLSIRINNKSNTIAVTTKNAFVEHELLNVKRIPTKGGGMAVQA
ncbi:hypothetical protein HPB47_001529 [Ixodes persulcatus]|uniref:Uncharacterized protein n=1 Tax=Ixodes persulcatus TaxID=34615 RepID=A0AC60PQA8_IXOPE|nr:hypothetical protein HPB47_001529 [Ixodes persulcatus]